MQTHDQVAGPPAHHAVDRRNRAFLHDSGEKGLVLSRERREFDVVELDAPDHGASAGARVGHLAPPAAGATLPVRLRWP